MMKRIIEHSKNTKREIMLQPELSAKLIHGNRDWILFLNRYCLDINVGVILIETAPKVLVALIW